MRAYLLAHPEVLRETAAKLDAKDMADDAAARRRAEVELPKSRAAIEHDPADFVANPTGRVTVTEFYDYRCPHCVEAAPQIVAMIHDRRDVRFVFKEMPIFGPTSEHAARAALAVKAAGGDYLGLYQDFMGARGLDDSAIDRLALARGARAADLADAREQNAHLAATRALFDRLNLGGTPAFIVGDHIISGANFPAILAAISATR